MDRARRTIISPGDVAAGNGPYADHAEKRKSENVAGGDDYAWKRRQAEDVGGGDPGHTVAGIKYVDQCPKRNSGSASGGAGYACHWQVQRKEETENIESHDGSRPARLQRCECC